MDDIYTAISSYCDCEKPTTNDINELIDLVSVATGWTQAPCETFLMAERREVVDIPDCIDNCDVFKFEPYYYPFDPESFTFTLVEEDGMDETETELEYRYSAVTDAFKLLLPLPNCACGPCVCGCQPTYKLVVTYMAGYEEIPACLLPLMCDAVHWIAEHNDCDCECVPCKEDDNEESSGMKLYFLEILEKLYRKQLGLISLFGRKRPRWLGAVI